ncbi:hypothetical protein BDW42DRAFT_180233 [Aspergillus taichungensis]|uniref:Uncharacterized protein n=1 Tax=Aspergillus taichungensis TaxID=482145 RepID=A0A2J5HFP2_9EURO|nr:hypothetical protein BDW42DRAFT_180233 [Aspergillus taichungensis]
MNINSNQYNRTLLMDPLLLLKQSQHFVLVEEVCLVGEVFNVGDGFLVWGVLPGDPCCWGGWEGLGFSLVYSLSSFIVSAWHVVIILTTWYFFFKKNHGHTSITFLIPDRITTPKPVAIWAHQGPLP